MHSKRLLALWAGTVLAASLLNSGCGNKDSGAPTGGYVAGTEATRKGGGEISAAPATPKVKTAPDTPGGAKAGGNDDGAKNTVAPPSNSVRAEGGANLAL